MSKKRYYIAQVLNNNAILTQDRNQNTSILVGKGIGFGNKAKTVVEIDEANIEKSFFNYDETLKTQLIDMITTYDENIVAVANDIIDIAERKFGELNQHIYVSLTDHISFALDRLKQNQVIANPFFEQIKILLIDEYEVAKRARKIIYNKFSITIPDEEVGFIAFHINAARENIKVNYVVKEMRIYKEVILMIEDSIGRGLNPALLSDLYLIIQKIVTQEKLPLQFLINDIKIKDYFNEHEKYVLLKKIVKYIEDSNTLTLSNQQKSVLAAYIANIK